MSQPQGQNQNRSEENAKKETSFLPVRGHAEYPAHQRLLLFAVIVDDGDGGIQRRPRGRVRLQEGVKEGK